MIITAKDKKKEEKQRAIQLEMKEEELKAYLRKINQESEKKNKDTIKCHMLDIRDEIEYL